MNMKKIFALLALVLAATLALAACSAGSSSINVNENTIVIDVRTPDEFKDGHIKTAKNIDIMSKEFAAKLGALDKTKPVLVHCQAGGRSTRALPTFEKLGFSEVYHRDGGMNDWNKASQPVVK
mgnify:CR=1 FL=1